MTKVVRLKKKTFRKIALLAGRLQAKTGFFVSVDDAVSFLLAKNEGKTRKFWRDLKKNKG